MAKTTEYYHFSAEAASTLGYIEATLDSGEKFSYTNCGVEIDAPDYHWIDKILIRTIEPNTEKIVHYERIDGTEMSKEKEAQANPYNEPLEIKSHSSYNLDISSHEMPHSLGNKSFGFDKQHMAKMRETRDLAEDTYIESKSSEHKFKK